MVRIRRCERGRAGWQAFVGVVFLCAVGCASPPSGGVLVGHWSPAGSPTQNIAVSFHREQYGQGTLSMQLGVSGERFAGPYLRIHETADEARVRRMHEMWVSDSFDGSQRDPAGLPTSGSGITLDGFRRHYNRAVVATLTGNRGGVMRCHLELVDTEKGLPGGATGTCESSHGDVVAIERRRSLNP
jgi:hypothetical protein